MAPRLKPLSDDKALQAIPVDEPVLVELEPGAVEDAPEHVDEPVRAKKDDADPGVAALQKQLDDARAATERERQATADARRQADEARRDADAARAAQTDSDETLIVNSLESAKAEQEAAQGAYEAAFEAGDAKAIAKAQVRIANATADIREYERAADDLKAKKQAEKDKPATKAAATVDEVIDRNPNLLPTEKDWMKLHPEVVTDPIRAQEVSVAYHRALREKLSRGTPEYFAFIDDFMGFKSADAGEEEESTIVAAPVARSAPSFNGKPPSKSRVTLTPTERQLAADMGLSDIEYARGKVQMESDRASNPERYARR